MCDLLSRVEEEGHQGGKEKVRLITYLWRELVS